MAHVLTVFSVPLTDYDPSVTQDKFLHSSKLPSALLAAGSLERSELLKEVTPFSKLQNYKTIFRIPIVCSSQPFTMF
jgi:hypothetical protein